MTIKTPSLAVLTFVILFSSLPFASAADTKACPADILKSPPHFTADKPSIRLECVTGDIYTFVLGGYKEGEIISPQTIQLMDPTQAMTAAFMQVSPMVNAKGNSTVQANFNQPSPRGTWTISVKGSEGSVASTSFDFKPVKKFLVSAKQIDKPDGSTDFVVVGSGWESNEPLVLGTQMPQGPASEKATGPANIHGFYGPIKVPFIANPLDGDYKLWLKGKSGQANLTITCANKKCAPTR